MQDQEIVALYWQREERAVRETEKKYAGYLFRIAFNILADREDSRESVNSTYWHAWRSMPPHRPRFLSTYLGRIARQLSIDRFRARGRDKRRASEYAASLEELGDCLPGGESTEQTVELRLLAQTIAGYLRGLSPQARGLFVCRYYYADPLKTAAARFGMTEAAAKSLLYRTRQGLRAYLEQEGFAP